MIFVIVRRRAHVVSESVISFRLHFLTSEFPIEAHLYYCGESNGVCTLISQIIHSLEELHKFQDEQIRREQEGEWIFIAYYETLALDCRGHGTFW
jgi:hypothetical protein